METHKTAGQILATLELPKPGQVTETPPVANKNSRQWLNKWVKLETKNNPRLADLEQGIFRFCSGYAKSPGTGRMLVLFGNNGTGKTHCAKAVLKWANHTARALPLVLAGENHFKQPDTLYVHWPTFLDNLKSGEWDLVDEAEEATLLILDEVGGGHDPSKMGLDKLCRVLSHREKQWTLVTTNFLPDAWEEVFDRRVASRLFRSAEHIDLSQVPDYCAA